jgi:hypothetical protein
MNNTNSFLSIAVSACFCKDIKFLEEYRKLPNIFSDRRAIIPSSQERKTKVHPTPTLRREMGNSGVKPKKFKCRCSYYSEEKGA